MAASGPSAWDLNSAFQAFENSGGTIALSFGGGYAYEGGYDLSQTCSNFSTLAAQYQAIIDAYQPARLDFDIEGPLLVANQTSLVSV